MLDYTAPERGRVALLTVNAQQDFVRPDSPLKACGVSRALPALKSLVGGFRARGVPIFHAVRLYRPDGSNVDCFRRRAVEEGLRILMPGTRGAELLPEAAPAADVHLDSAKLMTGGFQRLQDKEWAFYKPRWGAFHQTGFQERLRELRVSTLVVCGCNFTTSIRATVYEAGARDFRIIVATDALSGAEGECLWELGRIGIYLMDSQTCLEWHAHAPLSGVA